MKKLLWLDDIRDPNVADWLLNYAPEFANNNGEVFWVKKYHEFVSWIEENGLPDMICFDHDLSDIHISKSTYKEKTGYDCAKWLVEYCMEKNLPIPKFNIQSANPTGKMNIHSFLKNYQKFYDNNNSNN